MQYLKYHRARLQVYSHQHQLGIRLHQLRLLLPNHQNAYYILITCPGTRKLHVITSCRGEGIPSAMPSASLLCDVLDCLIGKRIRCNQCEHYASKRQDAVDFDVRQRKLISAKHTWIPMIPCLPLRFCILVYMRAISSVLFRSRAPCIACACCALQSVAHHGCTDNAQLQFFAGRCSVDCGCAASCLRSLEKCEKQAD